MEAPEAGCRAATMIYFAAGAISLFAIVVVAALLASRVRDVYFRDGIWARLWSRGPWNPEILNLPPDAPPLLQRFFHAVVVEGAQVGVVAEVRFSMTGGSATIASFPAGSYLAVLAWPEGFVIRWRRASVIPWTGYAYVDGDRLVVREHALGFVPIRRSTVVVADEAAVETVSMAMGLSFLWAPAAFLRDRPMRWSEQGAKTMAMALPNMSGSLSVAVSGQGLPIEVETERAATGLLPAEFVEAFGYRLPRRIEVGGEGGEVPRRVLKLESIRYSKPWTDRHRD